MATISQNLQTIATAKENIRQAIVNKGVACGTEVPLTDYATKIGDIPTGGGGGDVPIANDVRFLDYDGSVVHSYSKADFLALTEMPENPTHTGLTAQGWNWSLADAKTYVTSYDQLDIGQMYTTSDGKTRLYISLLNSSSLTVTIAFSQNSSGGTTVDWGDGSPTSLANNNGDNTVTHTYANTGDYVISLAGNNLTLTLNKNIFGSLPSSSYKIPVLRKVEFGNNFYRFWSVAPFSNTSVRTITFPSGSSYYWNSTYFSGASCLVHLTIPSANSITLASYAFSSLYSLRSISMPKGITTIPAFDSCINLERLTLPPTITSFHNANTFQNLKKIERLTLPSLSNINNYLNFSGCTALKRIYLNPNANVGSINSLNLKYLYSLEEISLPESWTTFGSSNCFTDAFNLKNIYLPSTITSIPAGFVSNGYSLENVYLKATTPPTIAANSFDFKNSQFKIHVPATALADYQAANVWSTTYIDYLVGDL